MPPLPMWRSSLYLPSMKPLCLPASSFSDCHSVSMPASTMAAAILSASSGRRWPFLAASAPRNFVNWSSSTSWLRRSRSRKSLAVMHPSSRGRSELLRLGRLSHPDAAGWRAARRLAAERRVRCRRRKRNLCSSRRRAGGSVQAVAASVATSRCLSRLKWGRLISQHSTGHLLRPESPCPDKPQRKSGWPRLGDWRWSETRRLLTWKGVDCRLYDPVVEIVHLHAGVDDDPLGVDAAGAGAEQEGDGIGHFFGRHRPAPQRGSLGK